MASDDEYVSILFNSIAVMEQDLDHQVDSIRLNLIKFLNIFGNPSKCRFCQNEDYYIGHQREYRSYMHDFSPKVYLSLDVKGEPFKVAEEGYPEASFFLATKSGKIVIKTMMGNSEVERNILDLEPPAMKSLIENNVLKKFLEQYSSAIEGQNNEYTEVLKISEKLI